MTVHAWLDQNPEPGCRLLKFRGDTLSFILNLSQPHRGHAWLRTNIGSASITRREIIRNVHREEAPLGRDWFDLPMEMVTPQLFRITVALCEVGHFEAKCFFKKEGDEEPAWPPGKNTTVNVEPAGTCCANIIYNAFVRQFGPNISGTFHPAVDSADISALDQAGYAVIPPSGTFRNMIARLDFIIGELGCRYLQLLPIHPTPTTYGRMGRFGSPYAALSFTAVDPALAEFDPAATPLEQFIELVDEAHARHAKIIIDIAINHTGWAASLHESHPEWLARDDSGHIEVPGAWGVRWEDLAKLDYSQRDLWVYMAEVFLTWCRRGVDGFRCDAGYMIPVEAWVYIIACIRTQFPDTIFLLEGLGGKLSVTRDLLNRAGFNWAYSELFQNYDRGQIEQFLPEVDEISERDGLMVHFAETHDNLRLAERSKAYARMRTAFCALFSHKGAFGFANGVEWFATEKIDVHNAASLNWGAVINQVGDIRRINALLYAHPAFSVDVDTRMIQQGEGNFLALLRSHRSSGKKLVILVNLDDQNPVGASWNAEETGMTEPRFIDLVTGKRVGVDLKGNRFSMPLEPGEALCLSQVESDLELADNAARGFAHEPERVLQQRSRAKALDVYLFYHNKGDIGTFDPESAARRLRRDPKAYCRELNPAGGEPKVISWNWPQDQHREVMLPPGHFLLVRIDAPFRSEIIDKDVTYSREESLPSKDGGYFALFSPLPVFRRQRSLSLKISAFDREGTRHVKAPMLCLPRPEDVRVKRIFSRPDVLKRSYLFLGTNGRGGMLRTGISWGELRSRYDALLAANPNPKIPEDRRVLFSRCRGWVVYQGYSQEIGNDCLVTFQHSYGLSGHWQYRIPTGQGESIRLDISIAMIPGENKVQLSFNRRSNGSVARRLPDRHPVQIILRPDIETRSFHETTKAYLGPEKLWPDAVQPRPDGFAFAPQGGIGLQVRLPGANFVSEPEWYYMVHRPLESERGLDSDSDLFSPGYFAFDLAGGRTGTLSAEMIEHSKDTGRSGKETPDCDGTEERNQNAESPISKPVTPIKALRAALDHYIVRRGELKSVIAGYPWFLDWGRDSLIVVRGLIAADRREEARAVLKLFGQYEKNGTIPNMIHGNNAGNRDTSDAPLWFFVACEDLVLRDGNEAFLENLWDGRKIRDILHSIAQAMIIGTPNGIRMDPASGLIFSPAHFTWMDTSHPAGTPREGYPIEIQALWYRSLIFLAEIDAANRQQWQERALRVRSSIADLFFIDEKGYFSDCLHASPGTPALSAQPDDALRPNQLLVLTLNAIDSDTIASSVLAACEELLVPGAIRSLADREVAVPLAITHNGQPVNTPHHPYQGRYEGDEDTRRKPAYHNGTAWTWLFPSYSEAWFRSYGEAGRQTALAWLGSGIQLLNRGCIGHVPEILDGNFPHTQRGCDAQAWGVSELLRVWTLLTSSSSGNIGDRRKGSLR